MYLKVFSFVMILSLVFGCTIKDNFVGAENEHGPQPDTLIISDTLFSDFYSFEDSIKVFSNNDVFIIGNYLENQSFGLILFSSFPDTITTFEDTIKYTLTIKENYANTDIENNLKIAVMKTNWQENEATWLIPEQDSLWSNGDFSEEDYEILNNYEVIVQGDSVEIFFENDLITNWINEEIDNFGILIYLDERDDSFVVFNSSESANSPVLNFQYKSCEADTVFTEYNKYVIYDTYINSKEASPEKMEILKIANICPTKMFLKFDISQESIIDLTNEIENELDYHRMTINKAELILHQLNDPYITDNSLSLKPYLVSLEDPNIPFIYDEDYEYISNTVVSSDSLDNGDFSVDITKIVQAITSGEKENFGIMIKSIYENKDFENIDFVIPDSTSSDINEPYIKIIYTPPFLDETK